MSIKLDEPLTKVAVQQSAPAGTLAPAEIVPSAKKKSGALHSPVFWLTCAPLIMVLGWALFPSLFSGLDPISGVPAEKFQAPGFAHWFGTDHLGRDVFARVVHGTSQTLLTAGLAVTIGLVVGTGLGLLAATAGRAADAVTMRLIDVLLAVPGFLISLIIVTAFAPGPISLGIGVGIASIASFARVVRSEVLRVRSLDYVEAAFMNGGTYWSVVFKHILPNSCGPVLALLAVDLGVAILAISGLGFLGFGSPPPTPEWGLLISEGRQYLASAWWLTTLPGVVIVVVVILLAGLGRQLHKIFRF